jgi:hypothetical protein
MSPLVKHTFRFVLLILIQYMLSNMAPLNGYVVPYMYFVFILWLPFSIKRGWLLVLAAIYGFAFDFLVLTPGIHASACIMIAYLRPFLISLLLAREVTALNYAEPSVTSMGFTAYVVYAIMLIFAHHITLVFLQWMTVGKFGYFFIKIISTTIISILLVAILEAVVSRKQKTRASLK